MKFSQDHEWVVIDGDIATIGITDYACESLGELIYIELPENGAQLSQGDELAVIESVKTANEVYSPISGEVIEVNTRLAEEFDLLNGSENTGWIARIQLENPEELEDLMDEDAYASYIEGE